MGPPLLYQHPRCFPVLQVCCSSNDQTRPGWTDHRCVVSCRGARWEVPERFSKPQDLICHCIGEVFLGAYSSTKFGVRELAQTVGMISRVKLSAPRDHPHVSLATEWGPQGITVHAYCPDTILFCSRDERSNKPNAEAIETSMHSSFFHRTNLDI